MGDQTNMWIKNGLWVVVSRWVYIMFGMFAFANNIMSGIVILSFRTEFDESCWVFFMSNHTARIIAHTKC